MNFQWPNYWRISVESISLAHFCLLFPLSLFPFPHPQRYKKLLEASVLLKVSCPPLIPSLLSTLFSTLLGQYKHHEPCLYLFFFFAYLVLCFDQSLASLLDCPRLHFFQATQKKYLTGGVWNYLQRDKRKTHLLILFPRSSFRHSPFPFSITLSLFLSSFLSL